MSLQLTVVLLLFSFSVLGQAVESGQKKLWHRVTLTFTHTDSLNEADTRNPFLDYRLIVKFTNGAQKYFVRGYFAADGDAANSSATGGTKWKCHFMPTNVGIWTYKAYFHRGNNISISTALNIDTAVAPIHGITDTFLVANSDKTGDDLRNLGKIIKTNTRYTRYASDGRRHFKIGMNSPENFLHSTDFDSTYNDEGSDFTTSYPYHVQHWNTGDPTWKDGDTLGKGIIGALNYMDSLGMNSLYFLSMTNFGGDGGDVWPWREPNDTTRYDISKLEQWEIVFSHADSLGFELDFIFNEAENDTAIGQGSPYYLSPARQLYYAEMISRFGHHPGIFWYIGEEVTPGKSITTGQLDTVRRWCQFVRKFDPYDSPIAVHTPTAQLNSIYTRLLGFTQMDIMSFQLNYIPANESYATDRWINDSQDAGNPWVVVGDEWGDNPYHEPSNSTHLDDWREGAWRNMLAGGGGVQLYAGTLDQSLDTFFLYEDYMTEMNYLKQFVSRIPIDISTMEGFKDNLLTTGHCMAKEPTDYAFYLPNGGGADLKINGVGTYAVYWVNPRDTFDIIEGDTIVSDVTGQWWYIGAPPLDPTEDWAGYIKRISTATSYKKEDDEDIYRVIRMDEFWKERLYVAVPPEYINN